MRRGKGKQTSIESALGALERRLESASGGRYLQVRVADAWERVAGETVNTHTAEVFLRGGELVVHVDSNVWAAELSALSGPYIEAMNSHLGKEMVRAIRFTVSRKVKASREGAEALEEQAALYTPHPERAVPLTASERAQVEASAAEIEDEELREAVVRATIASMEWQKGQRAAISREAAREGL